MTSYSKNLSLGETVKALLSAAIIFGAAYFIVQGFYWLGDYNEAKAIAEEKAEQKELTEKFIRSMARNYRYANTYYNEFADAIQQLGMNKPFYQVYDETETTVSVLAAYAANILEATDDGLPAIKNKKVRKALKQASVILYNIQNNKYQFAHKVREALKTPSQFSQTVETNHHLLDGQEAAFVKALAFVTDAKTAAGLEKNVKEFR